MVSSCRTIFTRSFRLDTIDVEKTGLISSETLYGTLDSLYGWNMHIMFMSSLASWDLERVDNHDYHVRIQLREYEDKSISFIFDTLTIKFLTNNNQYKFAPESDSFDEKVAKLGNPRRRNIVFRKSFYVPPEEDSLLVHFKAFFINSDSVVFDTNYYNFKMVRNEGKSKTMDSYTVDWTK